MTSFERQKYNQNESNLLVSIQEMSLIVLELNTFQKKLKIHRQQIYHKNIYKIQVFDSIISRYFSMGFVNFMFKGKSLLDYTNLSSRDDY